MKIDPKALDTDTIYKILKGTVVPRPIAWVSSVSASGIANLAPFSFFTVVSRNPPIVSVSTLGKDDLTSYKDTLNNIRETGEFVVNVVSLPLVDAMHGTAAAHPPETDEFDVVGLEKGACDIVRVPRVAAAPVSMECKVERILSVGDVSDHVVFGKVVRFHLRDDVVMDRHRIDISAIQPVGRLAIDYCLTDTVFTCPVPEVVTREAQARKEGHQYVAGIAELV